MVDFQIQRNQIAISWRVYRVRSEYEKNDACINIQVGYKSSQNEEEREWEQYVMAQAVLIQRENDEVCQHYLMSGQPKMTTLLPALNTMVAWYIATAACRPCFC